jgi:hypothetical protein
MTGILAVAIAALGLGATGAHAAQILGLYDTGVDDTGTPLAEGALDTHWTVTGAAAPVVYDNAAYTVPSDARFIAQEAGGQYTTNPNTYSLTFSLDGLNAATAQLSGMFEADNYATVFLNGHQLAQDVQGTDTANFQSLTAFSATSADFVSGANVLSVVLTDTGPPSAVLISGLSGTADLAGAVPEPAAWTLMIAGFGATGSMLRRRRQAALAA